MWVVPVVGGSGLRIGHHYLNVFNGSMQCKQPNRPYHPKGTSIGITRKKFTQKSKTSILTAVICMLPVRGVSCAGMKGSVTSEYTKKENGEKILNVIVETKDVENQTSLRAIEQAKIECAKVFFNQLTIDGYKVEFRTQLNNKKIRQILEEVLVE